jgi:hypothetical protein
MNFQKERNVFRTFGRVAASTLPACAFALGCYGYVASDASHLKLGTDVAIELNDLGRLNLSPQIGAEVAQVAGILQQQSATDFSMKVSELTYLNGRTAMWSGEPVTIRQDYVKDVFEKKVSPRRTVAAVVAGAGIVGGAIAAHTLLGGGNGNGGGDKPVPPPGTGYRGHQ